MRAPFFSIVIPHFNATRHLIQTFLSLDQQIYRDFEVIVVDDCSGPDEVDRLRVLCGAAGYRLLFLSANSGPSSARNRGVAESRGHFVCFLDSDDLWEPSYLAIKRREITESGKQVIVSTGYGFAHGRVLRRVNHIQAFSQLALFTNPIGCPSGVTVRADLAKNWAFREDLRLFEDYDYYIRNFRTEMLHLSRSVYFYRTEGQNTTARIVAQRASKWVSLLLAGNSELAHRGLARANSQYVTWKYMEEGRNLFALVANPFVWLRIAQRIGDLFLFRMNRERLQRTLNRALRGQS